MNEEQVEGEARNRVGGSEREKVQYKHEKRVSKNMRGAKRKKHMFRAAESNEFVYVQGCKQTFKILASPQLHELVCPRG